MKAFGVLPIHRKCFHDIVHRTSPQKCQFLLDGPNKILSSQDQKQKWAVCYAKSRKQPYIFTSFNVALKKNRSNLANFCFSFLGLRLDFPDDIDYTQIPISSLTFDTELSDLPDAAESSTFDIDVSTLTSRYVPSLSLFWDTHLILRDLSNLGLFN